ncbi:MAG TPA: phosphatase PAP2 family protein [Thermoanaerobaculia bacterium]|nr:phosphatase PAP2 family protein [Thermoanaerobaculia bacterium]
MMPLRSITPTTDIAERGLERGLWHRVLSLDEALLLRLVRRRESAPLTRLMRGLTHLGDTTSWVAIGLLLLSSGGRGPRYAALLGVGAGLAVAISHFLKRLCCRPRPTAELAGIPGTAGIAALIEIPDAFSFPSGHTAAAFAIAAALAGEGNGLGAVTLSLAAGIGLSRVYLAAHYPLDVAAGVGIGALCGLTARLLVGLVLPGLV